MTPSKGKYAALFSEMMVLSERAQDLPDDTLLELNRIFSENPELRVAVDRLVTEIPSESVWAEAAPHEEVVLTPPSNTIGLVFDFDETLSATSTGGAFLFDLGIDIKKLSLMVEEEENRGTHIGKIPENVTQRYLKEIGPGKGVTREDFKRFASHVEMAKGLEGTDNFFDRMRAYGKELGVEVQFHIASSNMYDIPANSSIAHQFNSINAQRLIYDEKTGFVTGSAQSVDFTTKTRMVSEISKGIVGKNATDGLLVNRRIPALIPIKNMIAVGDGETDIPFMAMTRNHGGKAIGVFNEKNPSASATILREDHAVDWLAPQDYSAGLALETAFKIEMRAMAERIRMERAVYERAAQDTLAVPLQQKMEMETASPRELLGKLIDLGRRVEKEPQAVASELDQVFAARPEVKAASEKLLEGMVAKPTAIEGNDGELVPPSRRVALVFDFDETVTDHNSIRRFFADRGIPESDLKEVADAWKAKGVHASQVGERVDMEMLPKMGVTKEELHNYGETIPLSAGLTGTNNFFDRMRAFAKEQGLELECHLASANITEILEGTEIAHEFESIKGMRLSFDPKTHLVNGCAESGNFTVKTRMVDEISKGLTHTHLPGHEGLLVNRQVPTLVPIKNMIAVADGKTDIAYMSYTRHQGGTTVGVYNPDAPEEITRTLRDDQRCDFLLPRDYRSGTPLEKAFEQAICKIAHRVHQEETAYAQKTQVKPIQMPVEEQAGHSMRH